MGFNGSKNCDRSSPEKFYNGYMGRKKRMIENGLKEYKRNKKYNVEKLKWEMLCYKEGKENKDEIMQLIISLLSPKPIELDDRSKDPIVLEAENLIGAP